MEARISSGEAGFGTAESAGTGRPHQGMASVDIGLAISGGGGSASGRDLGRAGDRQDADSRTSYINACVRQGHAAARSRCYAGQGQVAYAPVAEWLRSDAVRAGWTSLGPQQMAELARLVPEIREQFPDARTARARTTPARSPKAGSACISTNR